MGRRSISARMVGRDGELAELVDALASDDGERPLLLLAGEAGIGKTRLLAELTQRLSSDEAGSHPTTRVVRGSCLRLAESELPFAPFLEILDGLHALDATSESIVLLRQRMAGLAGQAAVGAETRAMWFTELRDSLVAAAGDRTLLVILDDVHWADRSTLDLVLFLARRLRGSRVSILAAYRSDELHRRHPLRPVLAELSAGYVRASVQLGPLDDQGVAEQVAELLGSEAPELLEAVIQRVDGNPFFVEELVALGSGSGRLPASLRDVLLARLASVDAATAEVLAACALVGRPVGTELLARVLGTETSTVERGIGEALEISILVAEPGAARYRFRHALLEEAVSDDLLPDARRTLHGRIAEALLDEGARGHEASSRAELARHLDAAGEVAAATAAYLDAAETAFRALGWAEGVIAFERAWTLLEGIDASDPLHARLWNLVDQAAKAMHWTMSRARAVTLLRDRAALAVAAGDRGRAVSLLLTLGRLLNDGGDEIGSREAYAAAVALGPVDPTTVAGVELLIAKSGDAWMAGRFRDAVVEADVAVQAAESLGAPDLLFMALIHRAQASIGLGRIDVGLEDVARARRLQDDHGWLDQFGLLATNIGVAFLDTGQLEASLAIFREGLETNKRMGTDAAWDPWNLPGVAAWAYLTGDWSDADAPVAAARSMAAPGLPTYFVEYVAAVLAAGRGEIDEAELALGRMAEHAPPPPGDYAAYVALTRAIVAGARGDASRQAEAAEAGLLAAEDVDTFVLRTRLAVEAATAAAELAATARQARDPTTVELAVSRAQSAARLAVDLDAGRIVPGVQSVAWSRANADVAALEAARAENIDDAEAWRSVAVQFEAIGMRPRVAEARFRAAWAFLRDGHRPQGQAELRIAADLAKGIGMAGLGHRVETLARAARIDLAASPASPPADRSAVDPWGLSIREREVLGLVAAGRTNGEIAEALFISPKTASVHVTHILQKLGVASRVEAALLASESGIAG